MSVLVDVLLVKVGDGIAGGMGWGGGWGGLSMPETYFM